MINYLPSKLLSNSGFSIVGELIAVAIMFIMIGSSVLLINYAKNQTQKMDYENQKRIYVDTLRKSFNSQKICSTIVEASQIIDISKPTIIKIDNAKLGPAPESFNLLSSDWSLIRTDASNNKTYRTDFSIEFLSNPTNKKFLGPLFVTVDNSNKFVTCFAEYSKEDKCKLLDGVYDTSTNQCRLSQAACPNGQYLVSAGVQKWICK